MDHSITWYNSRLMDMTAPAKANGKRNSNERERRLNNTECVHGYLLCKGTAVP